MEMMIMFYSMMMMEEEREQEEGLDTAIIINRGRKYNGKRIQDRQEKSQQQWMRRE